ncbi:hypothetical protein AYO20_08205 [Fonsecaea nubica]|uniref:Uncharacterized protein n=1 Tax=Fonsecaea nubica TaxID=856822 RepID=A0A178CQV0_9EURO|nr:hypothetical protein AYO20_08205 [Fonsecaea nubica]OAL31295.1 hypothetical protein AYO20_08205 [Fonsecaea nubica]
MFIGLGVINFVACALTGVGLIYVIDSYYSVAPEAVLLVNGLKSIFAFGFSYAIVPWITLSGYAKAFGAMGGIVLAIELCAIPFLIWGKEIRHWTSNNLRVVSW